MGETSKTPNAAICTASSVKESLSTPKSGNGVPAIERPCSLFIATFLMVKARGRWHNATLAASGAIALFSCLKYVLTLDYPKLQLLVTMPWPFN